MENEPVEQDVLVVCGQGKKSCCALKRFVYNRVCLFGVMVYLPFII